MQVYLVKAAERGRAVEVATVDSAKQAVIHYLDALGQYGRAWVSDASGNDILIDDLVNLALREGSSR